MRKRVEQMSPVELQELFTPRDLEAIHAQLADDANADAGFRDRVAEAAGEVIADTLPEAGRPAAASHPDAGEASLDAAEPDGDGAGPRENSAEEGEPPPAAYEARTRGCICSYRMVDPACPLHGRGMGPPPV